MNAIIKLSAVLILSSYLLFSQQWQQLNSGTNSYLRDLDFISENVGWVVGHGGIILKTTNGGSTWVQQVSNTSTDLYNVSFVDDQHGWVGGINGILLKTTDGGNNWIIGQITTDNIYGIKFIDENVGIAITGKLVPYYYSYIMKTTNGGTNWIVKYESFYGYDAYLDIFTIGDAGWTVGTGIIARTSNAGESWYDVYSPTDQWLYDVYFYDNSTGWAVGGGTDSEIILKSANGGLSWQIQRESYQYQRLQGVCFTDLQNGWTVGENGVILKTTNGGVNWNSFNSPTNNYLREVQFPTQTVGYIVGENGTILKYSDNSDLLNVLDPNGGEIITAGSSYYILWNSQNIVDVKIDYSTDNGVNWINIINSMPSTGIYEWAVPIAMTTQGRIKISDILDPNIFDISDGSFTIQSSKVITVITPNGGEELDGGSTYEITWNSTDVEFVDIEYSINNGASWNLIVDSVQSTGIYLWEVPNVLTIQGKIKIRDHSLPSIYDVSDQTFRINNIIPVELSSFSAVVNGKVVILSWITSTELNNEGFEIERIVDHNQNINSNWETIGFVPGYGTTTEPKTYSYTDINLQSGIYSYRLKQIDHDGSFNYSNEVKIELELLVNDFELFQNYPNPFNPTTKIQYVIPEFSFVTLSVYDVLGNLITTLVSENKPAGNYTVEFGSLDIPSGLYIYKLVTPNFTDAKKMILMK